MIRKAALTLALLLVGALAPAAAADPPPNDAATGAAPFELYTAVGGTPTERTATADLSQATPDPGVLPCLGSNSFARTVWYRIPATQTPRELTVEASGKTLGAVDMAAFVQAGPGQTVTRMPNVCAGDGVGGGDGSPDSTSGLTIRVGAYRDVLLQVGRHGPVGSPEDEQVLLNLYETLLPVADGPDGDRAGSATPSIPRGGLTTVSLANATTTQEDPFVPRCPAAASVWRRVRPPSTGRWTFSADGGDAATLSVFTGSRPTTNTLVGCVDRQGPGPMVLPVSAKRKRQLWVRVGTDRPVGGSVAQLRFRHAIPGDRLDGGSCLPSISRPRVSGRLVGGATVRGQNRGRTLLLRLRVTHAPLCGARFTLTGPKGKTYARGTAGIVRSSQVIGVTRFRKLRRGTYRLEVDSLGVGALRNRVPSTVRFRLR
jgi:hypothetical protein